MADSAFVETPIFYGVCRDLQRDPITLMYVTRLEIEGPPITDLQDLVGRAAVVKFTETPRPGELHGDEPVLPRAHARRPKNKRKPAIKATAKRLDKEEDA